MRITSETIFHEGVYMSYSPEPIFDGWYGVVSGVVVEERFREPAGMGMEPSGHHFMNYRDVSSFTFHPYSGARPVPCARPLGYRTCQLRRRP